MSLYNSSFVIFMLEKIMIYVKHIWIKTNKTYHLRV